MGKYVRLVDKDGHESVAIPEELYDEPGLMVDPDQTYKKAGFKIVGYDDGTPYEPRRRPEARSEK